MKHLKRLVTAATIFYLVVFITTLATKGRGFSFELFGLELKATSPLKYLFIALGLGFLRFLLGAGWRRSLLLAGSFLVTVVICEGMLRVIDLPMSRTPELQRWRRPHPTLDWELVPGLKGVGSYGYEISINSLGQRDRERPLVKPEGAYRILGVGDSFTFGVGVELKETFLKILERLLGGEGKGIDVMNAGVIAWGIDHVEAYSREKACAMNPDLVVYAIYWDDIPASVPPVDPESDTALASRRAIYEERMKEFSAPTSSGFRVGNLARNGYSFATSHFRYLFGADWLSSVETRRGYFADRNPDTAAIVHFANRVARMRDRLRADCGAEFATILIPDASQVGVQGLQRINRVLAEEFRRTGVEFVDATPSFESHPDPARLYLFPVDAHTSPEGNRVLAELLRERILKAFPRAAR